MSTADGKSTLIGSIHKKGYAIATLREEELEANRRALKNCPVHIIRLMEE